MKDGKKENIFSSKADVLNYFQRKIKNAKIEKMYVFSYYVSLIHL